MQLLIKDLSIAITLANLVSLLHDHLRELNYLVIAHFLPDPQVGQDRVLGHSVVAELEDFGSTIHSLSLSNQLLPLKKGSFIDQAHAAQVRINLDAITDFGRCSYLL